MELKIVHKMEIVEWDVHTYQFRIFRFDTVRRSTRINNVKVRSQEKLVLPDFV